MSKTPTEKQIILAERIAKVLNIDFPTCSREFTRYSYFNFIKTNIDEYKFVNDNSIMDEDTLLYLGLYENDAWCEHY